MGTTLRQNLLRTVCVNCVKPESIEEILLKKETYNECKQRIEFSVRNMKKGDKILSLSLSVERTLRNVLNSEVWIEDDFASIFQRAQIYRTLS